MWRSLRFKQAGDDGVGGLADGVVMAEELVFADEVGVEVGDDEVIGLVHAAFGGDIDGGGLGDAVQQVAGRKVAGFLPAFAGKPERMAAAAMERVVTYGDFYQSAGGANGGGQHGFVGQFAGLGMLLQHAVAHFDLVDTHRPLLGPHGRFGS